VSDTVNNKQDDTNVIRAQDIVPPYDKEKYPEQSSKDTTSSVSINQARLAEAGASEIPKFDLAEQILAEQRKITAIRRKAPDKKAKTPEPQPRIQSTGSAIRQPAPTLSEKELIIAEIVARDIEKLYRGDSSSLRNW
jgi:hypothetical protein